MDLPSFVPMGEIVGGLTIMMAGFETFGFSRNAVSEALQLSYNL
jgi:hypothetical protein